MTNEEKQELYESELVKAINRNVPRYNKENHISDEAQENNVKYFAEAAEKLIDNFHKYYPSYVAKFIESYNRKYYQEANDPVWTTYIIKKMAAYDAYELIFNKSLNIWKDIPKSLDDLYGLQTKQTMGKPIKGDWGK